ncbi:MAG TPA: hypothetical protein PKA41_04530 [Verrucomicrobiota bacterium]|nr:hypothetical protein [Verrucomicrobiota bacterium]
MKSISQFLIAIAVALLVCSCASTKLKSTWKSPEYKGGPVGKIAVLVVDDRGMVRKVLEGHTAGVLNSRGQPAFHVNELMSLEEIKADKNAAAAKLRAQGAEAILILQTVSSVTSSSGRKTGQKSESAIYQSGWFDFYLMAYDDNLTQVHGTLSQDLFIQSSLYDLNSEKRLWSCVTETVVKETSDKLELTKPLVNTIVAAMAADGLIR